MPQRLFPSNLPIQVRAVAVDSAAVDSEKRTVRVVFSSGAAVRRQRYVGWDGPAIPFDEILVVSRDAVQLDRLNAGAPVLDSHQTWSTQSQMAVVDRAWIEGRGANAVAYAELRFPQAGIDENADILFGKIADGIVRNVSCGYMLNEIEVTPANDKKGTVEIRKVTKWTPYEISFVAAGADALAQVRSGAESAYPVNITEGAASPEEEIAMDRNQLITEACRAAGFADLANGYIANAAMTIEAVRAELATKVAARQANEAETRRLAELSAAAEATRQRQAADEAARQAATAAERQRVTDIQEACRAFNMPAEAAAFITGGQDINAVRAALQAKLAAANPAPPTRGQAPNPGGQDVRETRIALMTNAFEHRLRPSVKLEEGARQYRGMSLIGMARECLEAVGVNARGLTPFEIASLACSNGENVLAMRAAGLHSTSDFPIILGNTVNRTLRNAYALAQVTYQRIAARSTAVDFRPLIRAQISDTPRLVKVNESGEFKYATISESSESYRLLSYGRIFAVTRQLLVNDDLGAFDRIPRGWGSAAAALENEIVWALIIANGNMADGNALFSVAHANLAADHEAINVRSVGEGRRSMRMQKTLDPNAPDGETGYFISNVPNLLAVPVARETEALQFVSPVVVPVNDGTVNPFKNSLEVLAEPLLDADSELSWYLMAEPARTGNASIEYAFLDGQDGVQTDQRIGFQVDGMEFKVRHDFGAGVLDYRGLYKNPGEVASE